MSTRVLRLSGTLENVLLDFRKSAVMLTILNLAETIRATRQLLHVRHVQLMNQSKQEMQECCEM